MTPREPAPARGHTIKVERLELDNIDNAAVYEVNAIGSSLAFTVNLFLAVPGENEALAAEIAKRYNAHAELVAALEEIFPLVQEVCSGYRIAKVRTLLAAVRGRP